MMNDHQDNSVSDLAVDSFGTADDRPPLVLLHGLSYDRQQWRPLLTELAVVDPDRRILALDLPGHGESPRTGAYSLAEAVAAVHRSVTAAGLQSPVVVGHSMGGVIATAYAARFGATAVMNVDQPLLVGPFRQLLLRVEPVLRSSSYLEVWDLMLASMHIDRLPTAVQGLARSTTPPPADLLLGYWGQLLVTPEEDLMAEQTAALDAIRTADIGYHYVAGEEPAPVFRDWLASLLPDVTITVLPGSGHFPHLAHPAALAQLLAAHSDQLADQARP